MILVVPAKHVSRVEAELKRRREKFYLIGRMENARGKHRVYTGKLSTPAPCPYPISGQAIPQKDITRRRFAVLRRTVLISLVMKKRIGVLLSGRGSNFEALADSVAAGRIPNAEIAHRVEQSRRARRESKRRARAESKRA